MSRLPITASALRDWLAALAVALVVSAAVAVLGESRLEGLSIDLLFWLRHHIAALPEPVNTPTVVVAIDEETYRRPPFSTTPAALWTREIAPVLDTLVKGGARVVGFDAVFPTSVEPLVSGFDRDFLLALRNAARENKVVLGEMQHQVLPVRPFAAQRFAVGNEKNVRALNLLSDSDEVVRRIPLTVDRETGNGVTLREPSMALELAMRAVGSQATALPDGRLRLGAYDIPGSERNAMALNFADHDKAIPAYSLADLRACAQDGNIAFFQQHFAGKVVLIGAVADIEDRKLTSMRFTTSADHPNDAARCVYSQSMPLFREDLVRQTVPGVYVLATAVDNLVLGNALRELAGPLQVGLIASLAVMAAACSILLLPTAAATALVALAGCWSLAATLAFRAGVVLPLLQPLLAVGLTFASLVGYRFGVTDREKRMLRSSFALYLAPSLVDRLVAAARLPQLGGELRQITVLFSDLAGFTSLAEGLTPTALVVAMNEYLTAMTEIIEGESGFVDKYIGDAIVAIFGAPLDDPDHAAHAVKAAIACNARLDELNQKSAVLAGHRLRMRIGMATGQALVGNIGSRRRFNYTAMGDVVNLASRLEGANKMYGTAILAPGATYVAVGDLVEWREIDTVRVEGREQPVTLFEPMALSGETSEEQRKISTAYAAALAEYRASRFEAAAASFDRLAASDAASRTLAARVRQYVKTPPAESWSAVTTLDQK